MSIENKIAASECGLAFELFDFVSRDPLTLFHAGLGLQDDAQEALDGSTLEGAVGV